MAGRGRFVARRATTGRAASPVPIEKGVDIGGELVVVLEEEAVG